MTKQEQVTLGAVASDIKWLKKTMDRVDKHLDTLNGHILEHAEKISKNGESNRGNGRMINRQWWMLGIVLSIVVTLAKIGVL